MVFSVGAGIYMIYLGCRVFVDRTSWGLGTSSAPANIVERIVDCDVDYYGHREYSYYFVLRINTQSIDGLITWPLLKAKVSNSLFKKYENSDSVFIFYDLKSPTTFLIKGE